MSLFFNVLLFYTCLIFHTFPYPHLLAFCCSRRFHHCMPLHLTLQRLSQTLTSTSPSSSTYVSLSKNTLLSRLPHHGGRLFSSSPEDGKAQFRSAMYISLFLASNLLTFVSSQIGVLGMCLFFFPRPVCSEFKMRAQFVSLLRTCLQPL